MTQDISDKIPQITVRLRPRSPSWQRVTGRLRLNSEMWFLPRVTPLGALLVVAGSTLLFALGLDVVAYVASGVVCAVLLLAIIFDLYEGTRK